MSLDETYLLHVGLACKSHSLCLFVSCSSIERERSASAEVTLLWARAALGKCRDFGARCRSPRGNDAAAAAGLPAGLSDWGPPIGRGGEGTYRIPPSGFASVTGTEGDLAWTAHPRLSEHGADFGRQYHWQCSIPP